MPVVAVLTHFHLHWCLSNAKKVSHCSLIILHITFSHGHCWKSLFWCTKLFSCRECEESFCLLTTADFDFGYIPNIDGCEASSFSRYILCLVARDPLWQHSFWHLLLTPLSDKMFASAPPSAPSSPISLTLHSTCFLEDRLCKTASKTWLLLWKPLQNPFPHVKSHLDLYSALNSADYSHMK